MAGKRIVGLGVAALAVVAAVVGVIAVISHSKSSADDNDAAALTTSSKAVASVCSQTDNKKVCVESLRSVASNQSATPKDFLQAALQATIEEVQAAKERSGKFAKAAKDPLNKMAVDDCKELLQYAVDELQASFSSVGDSDLHTMADREVEFKNWLSAVISYQQSCMDGFTQPDLQKDITNDLQNATKLTDNALAIVSSLSQILASFDIPANLTLPTSSTSQRRLLESQDNYKYPSWLSASDRKLLASQGNAGRPPVPNAVVAKDGSGKYRTIAAALAAYPKNLRGRYVIYVKAGVYNEYITVTKDQVNVFMYGDGPRKTIVTGHKSFKDGITTFQTATFSAIGSGFIAKSMGFQNTAGAIGHQAVALRVQSDMSAFYNCRIDGYQDSLYVQTHRQFYRNCVISGTIDFIFGDSSTIIQNSLIIVRKPMDNQQNTVTAHGRTNERESTGLVIQNCRIVPELKLEPVRFRIPTFLGRPWKMYARTVVMESTLADFIQPAGWMPWAGNFALDTLYYAEYANRGPGANTARRVKWKGFHVITNRNQALQFTAAPFIQANLWLRATGVPYLLGLSR